MSVRNWIVGFGTITIGLLIGLLTNAGQKMVDQVFPGFGQRICMESHLLTRDSSDAPFHIVLTGLRSDPGQNEFNRLVRSVERFDGQSDSALHTETLRCVIWSNADDRVEARTNAEAKARRIAEKTGADVVIWGEVIDAGSSLELSILHPADVSRTDYTIDGATLATAFGEDIGALIVAKVTTLSYVSDEMAGTHLVPILSQVRPVTSLLANAPPTGLTPLQRYEIHFADALTHGYLAEQAGIRAYLLRSIEQYNQSLRYVERGQNPLDWAKTQNNLGVALSTLGERTGDSQLYQDAIRAQEAALQELTQDSVPLDWAKTQNNLGTALSTLGRRTGDPEMLQDAIRAYEAALEELTRTRVPLDWAMTQNNLGAALSTLGERTGEPETLQDAIRAYQAALEELTQDSVPLDWAKTQNNLGVALTALGERTGDPEMLQDAIRAFEAALEEWTQVRAPLDWAMTQNNLGFALSTLGERTGDPEVLQDAIRAYQAALEERTRERVPLAWATTQNNLGVALSTLGERTGDPELLQDAIRAYEAALEERTRTRVPLDWAFTQGNLATLHRVLFDLSGDASDLDTAQAHLDAAVAVFEDSGATGYLDIAARIQAMIDARREE
ncbi:MAG: tetratricopeptide repeat protein [Pseudomonadota bacterium]